MALVCQSVSPGSHMVVAHPAHFSALAGLCAMWLVAHVGEFWYFLYIFFGSETGSGELLARGID